MKVWNYVMITITMILILQISGFYTGQGFFNFLNVEFTNQTGNSTDISSAGLSTSSFFDYITNVGLSTLIGAGISAGLFLTGKGDIAIKAGFASAVLVGMVTFLYLPLSLALAQGSASWAKALLLVVFLPYASGFLFSLIEFVVGGTSD